MAVKNFWAWLTKPHPSIETLERRVEARTRDLEFAAAVAKQITTILYINDLLDAVVAQTKTSFNLYAVSAFLYKPSSKNLVLEATTRDLSSTENQEINANWLVSTAAQTAQAVVVADVRQEAQYQPNPHLPDTKSEAAVPMLIGDRVLGVLDFQATTEKRFSEEDVRVLTTLAEQVAIGVRNAELFREIRVARQRAEIINDLSSKMTLATDEQGILSAINRFGAASTALSYFRLDDNQEPEALELGAVQTGTGTPIHVPTVLYQIDEYPGLRLILDSPNEPLFVEDMMTDPRFAEQGRAVIRALDWVGLIFIPLQSGGRWQGVLSMGWKDSRPFDEEIRALFTALMPRLADTVAARRAYLEVEAARQRAEIINEMNGKMTRATDEQGILSVINRPGALNASLHYFHFDAYDIPNALEIVALQLGNGQRVPIEAIPARVFNLKHYPVLNLIFATENEPIFIENMATDPRLSEAESQLLVSQNQNAMMLLPLKSANQWQAVLTMSWNTPHTFNQEDRLLMAALLPRLADNITARRAYLNAQAAYHETEQLYHVSRAVNAATTYPEILNALVSEFGPFDFDVVLNLYEDSAAELPFIDLIVIAQLPAGTTAAVPLNLKLTMPRIPSQDGVFVVEDMDNRALVSDRIADIYKGFEVMAILSTDLVIGTRTIGAIAFTAKKPRQFSVLERRLIRSIGELAAAAIERSRLYDEQVKVAEQLREVDNIKSRFLASVSHELRTPLNAILNFTKFVATGLLGPVNERQVDALNKTVSSGKHLLALINDVLDITKIESGMLTLFVETDIDLQAEIENIISTAETLLTDKPTVKLIKEVPETLPMLVGDRRRIRQILLNLVSNACKFTDEGSITISVQHDEKKVKITVKDTGPGIDPKDHDVIFESFRQTQAGLSQGGGTGLGLAIARRLAEAHHGKLWLESAVGSGASFYVSLPIESKALKELIAEASA